MVESIFAAGQRIAPLSGSGSSFPAAGAGESVTGPSFADTLKQALGEVSAVQENASETVQAYLRGEPVELHQVMAAGEEAGIAMEMLVELRNKLTETYRTVINMQS